MLLANASYCRFGLPRKSFCVPLMNSPTQIMRPVGERVLVTLRMMPRSARRRGLSSNMPKAFEADTAPGAAALSASANSVQCWSLTPGSSLLRTRGASGTRRSPAS